MADFVREPGEVEVLREAVETVEVAGPKLRTEACVVVTDRRVVLIAEQRSSSLRWMLGEFLSQLVEGQTRAMTHQIDRDDFARVEAEPGGMIRFHSKGEGYAHISFAICSSTPCEVWQQRMQQWAAGAMAAAPLPCATLRKPTRPRTAG